jgi:hypothetical protein
MTKEDIWRDLDKTQKRKATAALVAAFKGEIKKIPAGKQTAGKRNSVRPEDQRRVPWSDGLDSVAWGG